ncbi:MAG: ABC transporter substrate-binding protein [Rhizobiaceae bacterium]|nr:ABC transporter substrate-binding protein [Rhizobiaceae bacterium]
MKLRTVAAFIAALSASALTPLAAQAAKSDDTLRIVWKESVPNVDPHFNQLRSGIIINSLVMDTLILKNPSTGEFMPLLATSWEWLDDTTIRFKLREGVKFHNGEPFDADDVVYTLNFLVDPANKILTPNNSSFIKEAVKVDPFTVDVKLKTPFPAALEYLAGPLFIYPNEYHSKVGPEGMGKNLVGTGPYVMKEIDGVSRYLMTRNENYFDSPKLPAAIGNIEIRVVNDEATEMLELMSGKADWIWKFNADQVAQLDAQPNIQANLYESMRIGFLNFNILGAGDNKDNPIANVKVRQALAHAINKEELVEYLVQGDARAIDTPCFPAQFGCNVDAAVKYEYSPEKAKALLAEAGYPDGFSTQVIGARNAQWVAKVQEDLSKVGVKAEASVIQGATLVDLFGKGQVPIGYWDWGSYSVMDVSAILPAFFGGQSSSDRVGDKEVADLVAKGGSEVDPEKRKAIYDEAIKLITERALMVPIHSFVVPYAFTEELEFTATPDETPRFYWAKWK